MAINKNEYIVKARDTNLEIKNHVNKKGFTIFCIYVFLIISGMFFYNISILAICGIGFLFIISLAGIYIDSKWNLKVENKKIYLDKMYSKQIINYDTLINVYIDVNRSPKYLFKSYFLCIEYLKNNKNKIISLNYNLKNSDKVLEFCKCFITNKELEYKSNIGKDYFDVRDNKLDERIRNGIENENKLKCIVVILGIIIFMIMLISMFISLFIISLK